MTPMEQRSGTDSEEMPPLSDRQRAIREHSERLAGTVLDWRRRSRHFHQLDTAYTRFLVPEGSRVLEIGSGCGDLLAALKPSRGVGIDISPAMVELARRRHPETHLDFVEANAEDDSLARRVSGTFDVILLSDTIGYYDDCETSLRRLLAFAHPRTRLIISYRSRLWEPLLALAERLGLKMPQGPLNYLSSTDIANLMDLAGWQPVKRERRQLVPFGSLGVGSAINRWLAPLPLIRQVNLRSYIIGRPDGIRPATPPSVSVVVPCRNERGNIEAAVRRLPPFGSAQQIVFVEGHSRDGTYEECLRVQAAHPDRDIVVLRQSGKGKGDAVRDGFAAATGDILMILDADLTVPPEDMPRFYDVLASGKAEFVNGTRLVYPMEQGAMRFLNNLANHAFAWLFSFLLNQRFTDTLCGTKCLWREDYLKIAAGRAYFGEIDPFGDFDLLFGASKLNLRIAEMPVRYADRTYGTTQISRFSHGFLLLRMVLLAWRKLKAM